MPRIFATSDIHLDYDVNRAWLDQLSAIDYREDVLLLAGDVSDHMPILQRCFRELEKRFARVLYVPGNHDLWVARQPEIDDSLEKFERVRRLAADCGVSMEPFHMPGVSIVPLLGWYDDSFGVPSAQLREIWADYRACRWPDGLLPRDLAAHFTGANVLPAIAPGQTVISFSHFMPRIDLMPDSIPERHRIVYPVLGSALIERQLRELGSHIHVYGHSHVNRHVERDGVTYINNALAYPTETRISARTLKCVHGDPSER
jgi:predicted phosphodiesterase